MMTNANRGPAAPARAGTLWPLLALRAPVLFFLAMMCAGCVQRPASEPIRVGHLTALTGPERSRGENARRGIDLAVAAALAGEEKINERALLVFHSDHQGKADVLQAEAVRLLSVNRVSALIVDCDARLGEALGRATQGYNAPVILTRELTGPAPAGFWVLGAGTEPRGQALARFARQQLKVERAGLLSANDAPLPEAVADAFRLEWGRDAKLTMERWSFANDMSLAELLPRVKQWKPQALAVATDWPELAALRRRLAASELPVPLAFAGPDVPAALIREEASTPPLALASAFSTDALTDAGKEFARTYLEKFREPADLDAAQAYDALRLLIDTMRAAKMNSSRELRKELAKLEAFESVTGPIKFVERQARRAVFVLAIKEGRTELKLTVAPPE